ncbi:hypothetical protein [Nostoc linckia]|uniref:hypothetical protein n=1 Tax=Nostoc linckia TaxID=92942 RepID=UPI00117D8224|nr:hypothetical protein [Nostoc linckia]
MTNAQCPMPNDQCRTVPAPKGVVRERSRWFLYVALTPKKCRAMSHHVAHPTSVYLSPHFEILLVSDR